MSSLDIGGIDVQGPGLYPDVYTRVNLFGIPIITPAAGAEVSVSVPFGTIWRVCYLRATLTASGNAASRLVGFQVKNQDGNVVYGYNMTAALTAGLNATFLFSKDAGVAPTAIATTNRLILPAPDTLLPSGWSFGTTTLNIDAADQWSSVTAWVQELLPPEGE